MIDIKALLDSLDVTYSEEGKNVTPGWVNIRCLFCNDKSNHLGINLQSSYFHCWRCGTKGHLIKLVMELGGLSFHQAVQIVHDFEDELGIPSVLYDANVIRRDAVELPSHLLEALPQRHYEYLLQRGFDPFTLQELYQLRATNHLSELPHRLYIPIHQNKKLVTYTTRDVTGTAPNKYKSCANDKGIIPIKECLYNIDTVRETILIVEGPTDVWRIGAGAVATFGTAFTTAQINRILLCGSSRVFVLYDAENDAQRQATKLATLLSGVHPYVEVLELDSGDPGDLSESEVRELRRIVFE